MRYSNRPIIETEGPGILVTLGRVLEARFRKRSGEALTRMLRRAPKTVRVLRKGVEQLVPLGEVAKGEKILVRHGEQYDLTIRPETFMVSGAKIHVDDTSEGRGVLADRIESVRSLHETVDLLFRAFCEQRVGKNWNGELEQIGRWLKSDSARRKNPAA